MAAADATRVFTDQELALAGRLTVDLIAEKISGGDLVEAATLVRRFRQELFTMFYSYTGWEQSILDAFAVLDGADRRAEIIATIEDYTIAPERRVVIDGVAEAWKAETDDIIAQIGSGEVATLADRCHQLRQDALALHDGLMSRVTALLSLVYEAHAESGLSDVLQKVMQPEGMDPDGTLPFREKVENIILFTRCHLLPFSISEDDEKVTFMPDPCPSGARLIRGGHYEQPRNNALVTGPGPMTYGRKELPVYCCHEPAMELGSALNTGVPIFIVDPPPDVGISPCRIYVYKSAANIPEHYFRRLGLEKPTDLIAVSGGE